MRRRRQPRTPINAEINVVSLIDVMMLLLVIFMITAPMMQGGIDLQLPKADAQPLESKRQITVSIDRAHNIVVDGVRMNFNEFAGGAFKALAATKAQQGVYVQADATVPYQWVVEVLG